MALDVGLVTERLSRVHEWRADVLSHAEAFSSSFKPAPKPASIDELFEALAKVDRHDRETSLRVTRDLISTILLSERSSSERAKLLENCYSTTKDIYRDANDANPFASLLCEPLESVGVPALAYEIRRLSTDSRHARLSSLRDEGCAKSLELAGSHEPCALSQRSEESRNNLSGLHVLLFLIASWEGTLIPLSDAGSGDLIKTARRACLRLGDHDSGNGIFQRLRPFLCNQLNGYIRPSPNLMYSIEVFPNILEGDFPSPSRRKAILATDGIGFTAFIDIPHFYDAIVHTRSQPKCSQHSPSSTTPSPSSPLPPAPILPELLAIDFLAARCAWSLEIGRNSLRLTLLDSDGTLEGDGFEVDAAVEISITSESTHAGHSLPIYLPKSKLHFPSRPRTKANSIYLSPCFFSGRPSRLTPANKCEGLAESPTFYDIDGFDDKRLCYSSSGQLLLKLLVKFNASLSYPMDVHPSLLMTPPQHTPHHSSPASEETEPDSSSVDISKSNAFHHRTTSLPLVMISGPESVQDAEPETQLTKNNQILEASSCALPGKRPRALPKPPGSEIRIATPSNDRDSRLPGSRSPRSHFKQRSLSDINQILSSESYYAGGAQGSGQNTPTLRSTSPEPRVTIATRRPLPKRPSLNIDTVNLTPSSPELHGSSSPFQHLDPPSTITQDSTRVADTLGGLKTTTPTLSGSYSSFSSRSSRVEAHGMPSLLAPSSSDSQFLSVGDGHLQTSLHPLTPVSDVKDQTGLCVLNIDSDEKSWRSDMILEMESSFSMYLPANRFSDWQVPDDKIVIYPITIRYLAQYLHWWAGESNTTSASSQPTTKSFLSEACELSTGSLLKVIGMQASTREFLVGVLRRTEESSYRCYRNAKLNHAWSSLLRRSLQLDEQDLALSVSYVLKVSYDSAMQEAMAMESRDLLSLMDVLQSLIDRQYGTHRVLERFLQRIVDRTGILPKYLFLSSIKRIGDNPVAGGGFADVWKGKAGERTVALKVIRIFGLANPNETQHQEFCKEAMIWRQFCHQNILPFYGVCTEEFSPRLALVSPWMRNGDVVSYLKNSVDVNRIALIAGIALGLLYLHTLKPLVVHGDLRAANVLVDERGRPKLADFGLAKIVDSQVSTIATTSFNGKGAMRWQSPELLDSSRFGSACGITTYSDVYAFASVCLEVFTKDVPFSHLRDGQVFLEIVFHDRRPPRPATDSPAARCGLSDEIWALMERCWSTQPLHRPDMQTVVQGLTADCP